MANRAYPGARIIGAVTKVTVPASGSGASCRAPPSASCARPDAVIDGVADLLDTL
ncbi:MAG: hypothetical protein JO168_26955 [Solirubrobacterales bacterium]|nr:hypothetical protein [Solirubrobacterales bacterium]